MAHGLSEELISAIAGLAETYGLERLMLFGSRARQLPHGE